MKYTGKLYGKIGRRYVLLKTTSEEVDELEQRHSEICARLQQCVQKHQIGLGGEKIDALVCDHIEAQAAQIEAMREAIKQANAIIERYSESAISHANQLMCPECLRIEAFDEEHKDSCSIGKALAKLQPFATPGA